jgi:NAD(P)-dependent dehydrogenase (short-subunit alcohol dehydrogenase family)
LIESWMQGHRSLPIKTIDTAPEQSPAEVVDCIWRELAVPSYDNEVSYAGGVRRVVRAIESPLPLNNPADMSSPQALTPGGTWVFTGGARGITAYVAEKLAKRYQLKVHLLGKSSLPEIDRSWRDLNENGLKQLKMDVMTSARTRGENPVQAWQNTEKAIEIDATLRRFSQAGIEVYYHSCDVADRLSLRTALDRVRELSGPIHGVVHGAGVGKDSRFDRKQETKVNQCIEAKVDGSLALMEATAGDPLEAFIGFGSISGRFGANGHTDYSMANDMLCKQVNWLRRVRPNVKAVGFHWHAWGDIGMATKPETRLALEMIDMQFMPAEEGFRHLVAELESSSSDSEILITDDRYYRMFYPAETLVVDKQEAASNGQRLCSLIEVDTLAQQTGSHGYTAVVDPARDPFLTEHTLDGRPLLPFVIGTELLWEAAVLSLKSNQIVLSGIEAQNALRFFNTDKRQLTIEVEQHEAEAVVCRLSSDFVSRDGRIVGGKRINFVANAAVASASDRQAWPAVQVALPANATWVAAKYPAAGSKFYVGWSFQRLRKVCLVDGQVIGRISAPALVELAGGERNVRGWKVPCAALDACFFAVGMLAWQQVAPGSALPVRIGRLSLGRLPMPGESCEVHARLNSSDGDRASFDFTLYGVDGDVLISVHEYEIAWMASEKPLSRQNPAPQQRG